MTVKQKGTVAKWLNHKGIGFITPEGKELKEGEEGKNEHDVLVHFSQVKQESKDGFKSLNQGSTVYYDLEADPKNPEKMVAVNVTGLDGADCEARQKGQRKGGKGKKGSRKGKGKGKGKDSKDAEEEEEKDDE